MKGRKLLALALALALTLGLAVPALAAETATHADYADLMIQDPKTGAYRWEWAWATIDDTIAKGLFIGYTPYVDAQGNTITNFGPGDVVTQSVGLTLCARMMVDKDLREQILADRLEQMREIIPGTAANPDDESAPFMWFRREAAACLELGIIDADGLLDLRDGDLLGEAMTKAEFAKYLVRAMGLEDFAMSLNADALPFTDAAKITREYRPYVKLLTTYGVLTGDENGNFNPDSGMNRAVCATMLSRAIENIVVGHKVDLELPNYTDYVWAAGTIKGVDVDNTGSRTLTLADPYGVERSYELPSSVKVYLYNKLGDATDLKIGSYAKLVYATDKTTIASIRLTPAGLLSKISGSCDGVDAETVTVDGMDYALDRFTLVSAGGKTGGAEVIDPLSDYTRAELLANSQGVALTLTLSGGTRQVEGILADVNVNSSATSSTTTITVNSFSGLPSTYTLPHTVAVTVNGQAGELRSSHKGQHVILRVDDDHQSDVVSVNVDTSTSYVQGVLNTLSTDRDGTRQIQITKTSDSKRTPYEVQDTCATYYGGEAVTYNAITPGCYVTAKLEGGVVTEISAWSGTEEVTGVLTSLTPADPTVLTVTKEDGSAIQFAIPLDELDELEVTVDGKDANLTEVNTGDTVKVTLRYHQLVQIDATPRAADVTGTLDSLTRKSDGSTVLNVRFTDGTERQYTAFSGTTVTQNGLTVSLADVQPPTQVALVTEGDTVLSIQLTGSSVRQDSVEGIIYTKDDQARVVTVLVDLNGQSRRVNIHISNDATMVDATTGETIRGILRLSNGDTIQAYGSYNSDGSFEAKLIVRK